MIDIDIDYDDYIKETTRAWILKIDGEQHTFPKSICTLDIKDMAISWPMTKRI